MGAPEGVAFDVEDENLPRLEGLVVPACELETEVGFFVFQVPERHECEGVEAENSGGPFWEGGHVEVGVVGDRALPRRTGASEGDSLAVGEMSVRSVVGGGHSTSREQGRCKLSLCLSFKRLDVACFIVNKFKLRFTPEA